MTAQPIRPEDAAELRRLQQLSRQRKTPEAREAAYKFAALAYRLHQDGVSFNAIAAEAGVTSRSVRGRLQTFAFWHPYPGDEGSGKADRWHYRERLMAEDDAQRSTP
jgi:hypothetical protein